MPKINIIVAFDKFCGIGLNNKLPWKSLKPDMKRFKDLTVGSGNNCVVMGRKTYESLPDFTKPLKGRSNVVLSTTLSKSKDYLVIRDIKDVLKMNQYDEIWIIGGESVYKEAIRKLKIDGIYVTEVLIDCLCDRFFPFELITEDKYEKKVMKECMHNGTGMKFVNYYLKD